jgi:hypothetical protein
MSGLAQTSLSPVTTQPAPSIPSCSFYQSLEPGPNGTAVCKVTPWSIIVLPAKLIELALPELGPAVPGAEFLELGISVAAWVGLIWFVHSKISGK